MNKTQKTTLVSGIIQLYQKDDAHSRTLYMNSRNFKDLEMPLSISLSNKMVPTIPELESRSQQGSSFVPAAG